MNPTLVTLMLCVNDHRNGEFSGLCQDISLSDSDSLTLESPYIDRHLKCAIERGWFRLGKSHTWTHYGHGVWVGNWCWDAVRVTPSCAADVLNFAISKGYQVVVASGGLMVATNEKRPLTGNDLLTHCDR